MGRSGDPRKQPRPDGKTKPKAPPIPAEEGLFITVGVPKTNARWALQHAVQILKDHGFQAGITSDEAIRAANAALPDYEPVDTDDDEGATPA
jgi:hypothetical protein